MKNDAIALLSYAFQQRYFAALHRLVVNPVSARELSYALRVHLRSIDTGRYSDEVYDGVASCIARGRLEVGPFCETPDYYLGRLFETTYRVIEADPQRMKKLLAASTIDVPAWFR